MISTIFLAVVSSEVNTPVSELVNSPTAPCQGPQSTFPILAIPVILLYLFLFGLIIVGLIRLVKFLGTANKEMKLTRMELGKLAEEVQLLRKELKDNKER